jgi:hypothetical protein
MALDSADLAEVLQVLQRAPATQRAFMFDWLDILLNRMASMVSVGTSLRA